MSASSPRAIVLKKINKHLCLCAALLMMTGSLAAGATDEAIHDNKELLVPSTSPEVVAEKPSVTTEVEATPSDLSTQSIISDIAFWRARAVHMYGDSDYNYKVPVIEEQPNELKRKGARQRRNIYVPTRVYLAANDEIRMQVSHYPSATTTCSAYTFRNFDEAYQPPDINRMTLTENASNAYRAKTAGRLMLACVDSDANMNDWNNWNSFVSIATDPQHINGSLYIYGVTPPSNWSSIARSPDPSGQVYLFNGRTAMAFPATVAAAHAEADINAMLQEHLIITSSYDHMNGFARNDNPSPLDRLALSMYQASFNICCMSHYHNGLIGINFGGNRTLSDWGDWHEYGHQNQLAWKWEHLTEISVNLFSLEACQLLLGKQLSDFKNCHSNLGFITPDPEAVGKFLQADGIPIVPEDVASNRTLLMLAQLYTTYPDWHAQLAKDFRIAWDRGNNSGNFFTEAQRINWFVINTSRIVGRDLREFFDKWELPYSVATRQAIINLNLPQPIKPTAQYSAQWEIRSTPLIEGTIRVPPLVSAVGLVAYSKQEGPTTLTGSEEKYTKIKTFVVGSKRVPYPIILRGTVKHGVCTREYPINKIITCLSSDPNIYWKLVYEPGDNVEYPMPPADEYKGVLRLGVRSAYNKDWGGTLTVPFRL
ncbi:M60 family metallopeptidase [Pseudomonas sp. Pseusp122]|uniref:M60 family metallopeptidase n=1 Tax=unclassified Pseudomonas TaxID=196821 RepID=UPI0039A76B2D